LNVLNFGIKLQNPGEIDVVFILIEKKPHLDAVLNLSGTPIATAKSAQIA